ncbi:phage major capsid protein [Micromonospora craterilacus]|uniref:phage major capsid protein n=1 Tax=Micromonospora craterilacus TaxID=1655439 RepID=UPI001313EFF1|nr:hypothetical protein [Micromonospora craterilacus]
MPVTYPPVGPSLAGRLLTIHTLLRTPTLLSLRMQQLSDIKFVADLLLPQRYRSSGGAVLYEEDEPLFTDREVEAVAAGAEYPFANPQTGVPALAAVVKWGQATRLTDERIKRTLPMGGSVDWALRKVTNTVRRKVDRIAIAAIASRVQAFHNASAAWTSNTAAMLRDIEIAKSKVEDLELGHELDMMLLTNEKYALLATDDKVASLRRREVSDNPVYGGEIETFAGLKVAKTSQGNMPGGTNDVWLFDSRNLGGMADEVEVDPGYAVSPNGIQVQVERVARRDAHDMWARRITVPVVTDPSAGIRIANTN